MCCLTLYGKPFVRVRVIIVSHNRRINILYIHANNTDIGGSDYCMFKLVTTLDRNRFNPMVLLGLETEIANKYREYGIPVLIMPMHRIRRTKDLRYQLSFIFSFFPTVFSIARLIKKYDINIVHSNDFQDFYGAIAARISGAKAIQHDRLIMRRPVWLRKLLTSFMLAINHRVAVVSDAVGREMFSRNGKVHPKVVTCYDWLDMDRVGHTPNNGDFREDINFSKGHTLVGAVGRLEPWKGQHVFISAAARVAQIYPEVKFVIVGGKVSGRGREKYQYELQDLASNLHLNGKIFFAGHRTDIANVMAALDIYVHSSIEPDPLPGVVMEAMALGKPVVGPRAGGVPEEVEEGVTGLLYEPGDYEDMSKSICSLIASAELRQRFEEAGKRRANALFNKEKLCRYMESVYEAII